jgi:hypothetical protein
MSQGSLNEIGGRPAKQEDGEVKPVDPWRRRAIASRSWVDRHVPGLAALEGRSTYRPTWGDGIFEAKALRGRPRKEPG